VHRYPLNLPLGRLSQPVMSNIHAESAIGLVSTRSFPAMVGTADMMLKSAAVHLVGYEKIGNGYCTAVIRGRFPDVKLAVAAGAEVAEQMDELISKSVISRPFPNLDAVLPISDRLLAQIVSKSKLSNLAIGLLETRGFPPMVGAMDAMLKTADVHVAGYEKTGAGFCTAIIRGTVSNVTIALDVGMSAAEQIGELRSIMVIPRPLEDLERTIPTASYWLEPVLTIPEQPLVLPLRLPQVVNVPVVETAPLVEVEVVEAEPLKLNENQESLDN
jgi:carbon dioxide concentrating mechanism protein CcmO